MCLRRGINAVSFLLVFMLCSRYFYPRGASATRASRT